MNIEPNNCVWCGSEPTVVEHYPRQWLVCCDSPLCVLSLVYSGYAETDEAAIARWNKATPGLVNESTINTCPSCHEPAFAVDYDDGRNHKDTWHVRCGDPRGICGFAEVETHSYHTADEAWARWNTRAPLEAL